MACTITIWLKVDTGYKKCADEEQEAYRENFTKNIWLFAWYANIVQKILDMRRRQSEKIQ